MKITNKMEGAALHKRRFSYLNKLIADEDIPLEELQCLRVSGGHENKKMDVYSASRPSPHFETKASGSEFETEAYLEYRRRVFEQLAEEYENEKQKTASGAVEEEQSDHLPPDLHASYDSAYGINGYNINDNGSEPLKFSADLQPTWDDSDLRSETYTLPSDDQGSHAIPWQTRHSPSKELTNLSNSVNALDNAKNGKALITWSSFDDRIQEAELEESNDSLTEKKDKAREQMQRSWRTGRNSFQKQKMEREMIRKKLSMTDPDDDDFKFGSDKPWYQPRFERAYSSSSQSLQICYINDSCSSDEAESQSSADKHSSGSGSSTALSPTSSPNFESARGYGMGYMRQHRLSDGSNASPLSSPSLSLASNNSESTIIHHHSHHGLRSGRSKQEQLELEARYELAQAHQRAKLLAERDRRESTPVNESSIVYQLLSVTLDDETNNKIKSYALKRSDCDRMTLGQLQLILNDMHSKKQALNDSLVKLLLDRDELQTAQDSKLVDIEDMKSILNSVGPETTV